jgi:hypothetical protein
MRTPVGMSGSENSVELELIIEPVHEKGDEYLNLNKRGIR